MNELFQTLNLHVEAHLGGPELLAALVVMGLAIGVLTGMFGVGGGFLVVPMLNILFGVRYELAVGSSLSFIVGTGTAGLPRQIRLGNVNIKCMLLLAAGSMIGAVLGDWMQEFLVNTAAGGDRLTFEKIMHSLFIVMLLAVAWRMFRKPAAATGGKTLLQRLALPPRIDLPNAGLTGLSLPGIGIVGLCAGVLTGVLGVGGGILFVPVLVLLIGLDPHKAMGTSLGVIMLAALAGAIKKGFAGKVSLTIAMALLAGSAIGVQIGIWAAQKLHSDRLRRWFAGVTFLIAVIVAADLANKFLQD